MRVISQLGGGGGGGGGVVQQGARDATVQAWFVDFNGVAQPISAAQLPAALVGGRLDVNLGASPVTLTIQDGGNVISIDDAGGSLTVDTPQLPAALVGGRLDVNLGAGKAREDAAAMTWVSVKSAAPAANSVQADTGALAAGDYDFDVQVFAADTVAVGKGLVLEHRNAANGATLFNLGGCGVGSGTQIRLRRYTIAANERLRIIAGTAAGAASSMYVSAIGRRLT